MSEAPEGPEPPEPTARSSFLLEELGGAGPSPDRRMFTLFAIVLSASMAGVLWLALRSGTTGPLRETLDFVLQVSMAALLAYAGFRALALFPVRFFDLLAIVAVLPLFLKITVETIERIAAWPFLKLNQSESHIGITIQMCSIAASIFLAGATLGLRHCHILKIENSIKRVAAVLSSMLALPAAAGVIVFPLLLLWDVLLHSGPEPETTEYLAWWLVSIMATVVNAAYIIRSMTLTHVIEARERLP